MKYFTTRINLKNFLSEDKEVLKALNIAISNLKDFEFDNEGQGGGIDCGEFLDAMFFANLTGIRIVIYAKSSLISELEDFEESEKAEFKFSKKKFLKMLELKTFLA